MCRCHARWGAGGSVGPCHGQYWNLLSQGTNTGGVELTSTSVLSPGTEWFTVTLKNRANGYRKYGRGHQG